MLTSETTPLLSASAIKSALSNLTDALHLDLHLFQSIDSTQSYLKKQPQTHSSSVISICLAEEQTAGRGRFKRHWNSPYGEHIYCSIRLPIRKALPGRSALGLVVSLSILTMLKHLNITTELQIKWPNDLVWKDKKLAGILIEVIDEDATNMNVIIGIGLNVNGPSSHSPDLTNPWCTLYDIIQEPLDRNPLIAQLIHQLYADIEQFNQHGLPLFLERWKSVDYLYNKWIEVSHHKHILEGRAQGINEIGQLRLMGKNGEIHVLSSGDTSILKK